MKRKKIVFSTLILTTTLMVGSCGGNGENNEIQTIETVDTAAVEVVETVHIDYSVPTPNELFEIIKLQGGEQKIGLVNPLENAANYVDQKSKSLNFGVYSADVAYLSCFGIGVDFLKYFKKIEELGEELGISGAFDEQIMERIENNEGDTDSLFAISNDSYFQSYSYLEQNDKGVELSLIMAGGYIESLHIITNLVEKFNSEDPIIKKIGDQRVVLENLIDFLSTYSEDSSVAEIIEDLEELKTVFENSMELTESDASVSNGDNGKLIISGGGSYKMTEKSLADITAKSKELRDKITK